MPTIESAEAEGLKVTTDYQAHPIGPRGNYVLLGDDWIEIGLTMEPPFVNDNANTDCDALLDEFAAELTIAAYQVAFRHSAAGTWLDLELELWRAMADTVKQWDRCAPGPVPLGSPDLEGELTLRKPRNKRQHH